MTLNPIQFGKDVVDQYGRYLLTTFRLADHELRYQLEEGLRSGPGSQDRLAKGPYVFLSRPFVQGPGLAELVREPGLGLSPALEGLFDYPSLHKHQEKALRAALAGRHVLMATGTGSGKTEGFLLPILDHCLKLRDAEAEAGVVALLIYPMNALVNDQLDRMRRLLAGSRITFGRYTGDTPEEGSGPGRLETPRRYTDAERERADRREEELPLPWEECYSRAEIRKRRPRILLTNYSQLEYLLLRDKDLDLFRGAPLRFFVLDEIHTYSGTLGSEVACLIRRLRTVAGKGKDDVVCIGSSATVTDRESARGADQTLRVFASRLFGVADGDVELVKEEYQRVRSSGEERYVPPPPEAPTDLLERILEGVREAVLADEVKEVSDEVVRLAERLCGRQAPVTGGSLERLHSLLRRSRVTDLLVEAFGQPAVLLETLPRLRALPGRDRATDMDLQAEVLAYLTLGALAREGDEPLLRPKLHVFLQGLHGLWIQYGWRGPELERTLHFTEVSDEKGFRLPLSICRSCGQHFVLAQALEPQAVQAGDEVAGFQMLEPVAGRPEVEDGDGRSLFYLTDALVGGGGEEAGSAGAEAYLCEACGALHDTPGDQCLQPSCRHPRALIPLQRFPHPSISCPACDARGSERSPVITAIRSMEVYDVMVLAQTALSSMPERDLRKLLVFADSRQDAAFQAGWMESRSLRFRVRHLAYAVLDEAEERWLYFEDLLRRVVDRATEEGMISVRGRAREEQEQRLRWILLEEFFNSTERQRRNSLEQLGMARVHYEGLHSEAFQQFAGVWGPELGATPAAVLDVVALVLDYIRHRHAVNHPMLQRKWSDHDLEVMEGIVSVPEYWWPNVVLEGSPSGDTQKRCGFGFRSARGDRSAVERLVTKAFEGMKKEGRDAFLEELWRLLAREEVLVPAQLKQKRHGQVQIIPDLGGARQLNLDQVQIGRAEGRFVCSHCGTSRSVAPPTARCPSYNCRGTLELQPRDEEHYDVVQYTRMEFVPLLAREHSAQVPAEQRLEAEREFKQAGGKINCLVATPTLELGVDIGPLEMVLMRNVPPSPANYAQRSGRAGRRHRIGVVFSYCRDVQHDQYFYRDPPEMISGRVRIPGFSMRNEPLIRRHVHSALLTELRNLPGTEDILAETFPSFIWEYFGERAQSPDERSKIRREAPTFAALDGLLKAERDHLLQVLERTFTAQWPQEEADAVSAPALQRLLDGTAGDLEEAVGLLLAEVKAYQQIISELSAIVAKGEQLRIDERRREQAYRSALSRLWREEQENYSITYLARKGFFPGYALVRDSVHAWSADPYLDLYRANSVAIRELVPAARIYANRQQFRVLNLDFNRLQARQPGFDPKNLVEWMTWDRVRDRVDVGAPGFEGGEDPTRSIASMRMVDVRLDPLGKISDQQEYRYRTAYNLKSVLLPEHRGGEAGRVGAVAYQTLSDARLRIVNLGVRSARSSAPEGYGYPICGVCGEARSPFASVAEIQDFTEHHERRCGTQAWWLALHTDVASDILRLGPFQDDDGAVNVAVALQLGAQQVLEARDQELEIALIPQEDDRPVSVLFDPAPGGSGLLPLLQEHWSDVVAAARDVLRSCDCEKACYRCMLHYRNQQHHAVLDRHRALNALGECDGEFIKEMDVPPTFVDREVDPKKGDGPAEPELVRQLRKAHFPMPEAQQHRVELSGGSFTVADFAYPSKKVLLYVDGLSERIHGNEEQRRKDRRARAKAEMAGWRVLAISAQGLKDHVVLTDFLDRLAVFLGEG